MNTEWFTESITAITGLVPWYRGGPDSIFASWSDIPAIRVRRHYPADREGYRLEGFDWIDSDEDLVTIHPDNGMTPLHEQETFVGLFPITFTTEQVQQRIQQAEQNENPEENR